MTVSVVLHLVWVWVLAHPAEFTMLVGAAASMLEGMLGKVPVVGPWLAKVAGVLSSAGVNVPALKDGVVSFFVKEVNVVANKEVKK